MIAMKEGGDFYDENDGGDVIHHAMREAVLRCTVRIVRT